MKRYIRFVTNLLRTIIFNFQVLELSDAIKLPIWLNQKVVVHGSSGKVHFAVPVKRRMVVFTTIHSEILGESPSHWKNQGKVIINGENIRVGSGTSIICLRGGEIQIGNNVTLGGKNKVISQEKIVLGSNLRTAWDVQIIDTNFHYTINKSSNIIHSKQKTILIGEDCWLANRCSIMKGAILPNKSIVASHSIVNKHFIVPENEFSIVVGGSPAKIIGYNISRLRLTGDQEIEMTEELRRLNLDCMEVEDVEKLKLDY
ncbi:acyltransferase [Flavobacterium sp. 14A]|uniref:acyltransferase n=1 Tax=Flavobacterium sp. 14A TaxID=2735896 RepID=UPI00156F38E7|nr:acyltransferase [Flavobacterium sp. 14A]NRT13279.1 acetyltransferase-like isoleucine patch superfamily enzyme [Flavobacterium sp. 14A]